MLDSNLDRGPSTTMRGALSDVYLRALLEPSMRDKALESLALRLGARGTVDDPLHGRATGTEAIGGLLRKASEWLARRGGAYERLAFTTGIDRDVTEGTVSLTTDGGGQVALPIAVVAERRPSREVELRVYYATSGVEGTARPRARLVPDKPAMIFAPPVGELLDGLARGDLDAFEATFEVGGALRDATGREHEKRGGGLRGFVEGLIARGALSAGIERGGETDDGRRCAVEVTWSGAQAGLVVVERGDSALIKAARFYGDMPRGG